MRTDDKPWRPYLHVTTQQIDLHPEAYRTSDPEVVARDVLAIVHAAERLGLERCTFICGRGLRNPSGKRGALIDHIGRTLQPQVGRRISSVERDGGHGALVATFAWARCRKARLEKTNVAFCRLREIPAVGTRGGLARAKSMLHRIFLDWKIRIEFREPLGRWGLAALQAARVPSDLKEELVAVALSWGSVELHDSDGDLDTRKRMARDLLELWSAPSDLHELLELVESRTDWQDTFLAEYLRWTGEMT